MNTGRFSFVDLLGGADDPAVRVRARLALVPTNEGGRTAPLSPQYKYRPNHNFGDADNRVFYIGQITWTGDTLIHPGESTEVEVEFLPGRGLVECAVPGRRWRIQEGPKLVAIGEVIEVLPMDKTQK